MIRSLIIAGNYVVEVAAEEQRVIAQSTRAFLSEMNKLPFSFSFSLSDSGHPAVTNSYQPERLRVIPAQPRSAMAEPRPTGRMERPP